MNPVHEEKPDTIVVSNDIALQGVAAVVKNDEPEKVDWNELLKQAPECGEPASNQGATEGDEVSLYMNV